MKPWDRIGQTVDSPGSLGVASNRIRHPVAMMFNDANPGYHP